MHVSGRLLVVIVACLCMSFSNKKVQTSKLSCENLVLNGDANLQGDHWNIEGHWTRFLELDNNNNTAFKLWNTSGGMSGYLQEIAISEELWNQKATLSGWVKRAEEGSEKLGAPIIQANFLDKKAVVIQSTELSGTKDDWELLRKQLLIPERSVTVQIHLKAGSLEEGVLQGGFTSYFDNIAFTNCDETLPRPGSIAP